MRSDKPEEIYSGDRFDLSALEYRRFRPGYPPEVVQDIIKVTKLAKGARILEIGCGTGQATPMFYVLSPDQISIDPGKRLLEECVESISNLSGYRLVHSKFEDFPGSSHSFDLIYAATSFHWVRGSDRYQKLADLLVPGGYFARITHSHRKNLDGFFSEVQAIYQRLAPEMTWKTRKNLTGSDENTMPLELIFSNEYDLEVKYTGEEYSGLLQTFSDHIALGKERLEVLCHEVSQLIADGYCGMISKTLTTELLLYRSN